MSPATAQLPSAVAPGWPIYPLPVESYLRMTEAGVLTEDDPVELLEGFLVPKMPKSPLHDGSLALLERLLRQLLPAGWHLRGQSGLLTADSAPEPDLAIIRGDEAAYRRQHPTGADVAIVIEIADTSLRRDRRKADLYARAGVPEYWIVNLDDWQLERRTEPQVDGTWQNNETYRADQVLSLVLEGHTIGQLSLQELLTPPS